MNAITYRDGFSADELRRMADGVARRMLRMHQLAARTNDRRAAHLRESAGQLVEIVVWLLAQACAMSR